MVTHQGARHRHAGLRALCASLILAGGLCASLGVAQSAPALVVQPAVASVRGRARLPRLGRISSTRPRNIILVVADDHRYDALSFLGHPLVQTPHLDAMARAGVHVRNAFVTTSLCSPSRASILTGLYAHRHGVVSNGDDVRAGIVFFPQHLQQAGYETGFFGKWHMGGQDDGPRPGFDRWVSFRGQGTYYPSSDGLNVDGRRVPQKGYITDELTDYALDWLRQRGRLRPFFLYLSHKGVHADFEPAFRHVGRFADQRRFLASSRADGTGAHSGQPRWVRDQRNSWHGVDYPFHSVLDIEEYFRRYAETLLSVDESLGRLMQYLKDAGLYDSTLVIYMGDNGFAFGEHGLIDKRTAYEESMRIPLLVQCPEWIPGGTTIDAMVANIDIAPTVLEVAGLRVPVGLDGRSFVPLLRGLGGPWRRTLLYEYYWERSFPHTPTLFALRGERYKYIQVHGVWDVDELYDLKTDPGEHHNLIASPAHQAIVAEMNAELWRMLLATDGMAIPLRPDHGRRYNRRRSSGAAPGEFPSVLVDPLQAFRSAPLVRSVALAQRERVGHWLCPDVEFLFARELGRTGRCVPSSIGRESAGTRSCSCAVAAWPARFSRSRAARCRGGIQNSQFPHRAPPVNFESTTAPLYARIAGHERLGQSVHRSEGLIGSVRSRAAKPGHGRCPGGTLGLRHRPAHG